MQIGSRDLSKSLDITLHPTLKAWLWISHIKSNGRNCIGIAKQIEVLDSYSQPNPIQIRFWIVTGDQIQVLDSYMQPNPINQRLWIVTANQTKVLDSYSQSNPMKQKVLDS